jgi:hypothetical protein
MDAPPPDETDERVADAVDAAEPSGQDERLGDATAGASRPSSPVPAAARPQETLFQPDNVEHRTKRVRVFDRDTTVVLQNENGPCPLLAVVNALALNGRLVLPSGPPRVAQSELLTLVAASLLESGDQGDANRAQNVRDALAMLPKLATGLDVNVRFSACDAFEFTADLAVFDALRLPLLHGWLVSEQCPVTRDALAQLSYNRVVDLLVEDSTPPERRAVLEQFLEASASQLTEAGLAALHALPPGTLGVCFRNNHFATCYVHEQAPSGERLFCLLVTDEGYRDQHCLVWESLSDTRGDTPFLTGDFRMFTAPTDAGGRDSGAAQQNLPAVSDAEAALLRQLQEEEDLATARLLSEQQPSQLVGRPAQGSYGSGAGGAAVAGAAAMEGVEADSAMAASSLPLFTAIENGDIDEVVIALASGVDMNARDMLGRTPLHWAASGGRAQITELLLANNANCNVADENRYTPLHLAAAAGQATICRMLLEAGADAALVDATGATPAALAAQGSHAEVVALLRSHPKALAAAQRSAARAVQAQLQGGSGASQGSARRRPSPRRAASGEADSDSTPGWLRPIVSFFKGE